MRTILHHVVGTLLLGVCFFMPPSAAAADHGTAAEAIALVQKAGAYLKANGKEKLIAEVVNPHGQFRDRDLYITVADLHGVNLAHATNPKITGKNLIDLRDDKGKYFVRERVELLKTKNSGWVNYTWTNPTTNQLEPKSMYFERFDDVSIQCGIYQ